ncbi:hypothetical protein MMC13_007652 [Lambiella insularis]|nr:hypothetical protein [Lambiella insularis]
MTSDSGGSPRSNTPGDESIWDDFVIENCGSRELALAEVLQDGLDSVMGLTEKFQTEDLDMPGLGPIFRAMFKNQDVARSVSKILGDISTDKGEYGLFPDPHTDSSPHFMCYDENAHRLYQWPNDLIRTGCFVHPDTIAFYYGGTRYIIICPRFWGMTRDYDSRRHRCPTVTNNMFTDHVEKFIGYQSSVLIHELIHFYLQERSLAQHTTPQEVYEWNACVLLNSVDSSRNPTNYELFIASAYYILAVTDDP